MDEIREIARNINSMSQSEISEFFKELLTESEIQTLSKRWRILKMLSKDYTQREIAKDLSVSLCKVTRGAKILNQQNAIITKIMKGYKNDNEHTAKN